MMNPVKLEEIYQEFTSNLKKWLPDGIIEVDLNLLHELGLLSKDGTELALNDDFTQYFHVIETPDKVTLFNEQFAIWIVPLNQEPTPSTMTYIALTGNKTHHLEIVFCTKGVYNTPKYILSILQHYLKDVIDNESIISSINDNTGS